MGKITIGEGYWATWYADLNSMFTELYNAIAGITSKQDTLVSGTNIKTINGGSVLGPGDISIVGAGGDVVGPAGATSDHVVVFNGATGKAIKDSGVVMPVSNANHSGDAIGDTALTLKTVNSSVGSFSHANITVNEKGLVTAASSGPTALRPYSQVFNIAAGIISTVITTLTTKPYSVQFWDSSGIYLNSAISIEETIIATFYSYNLYSVDAMNNVEIRIAY